MLSSFTNKSQKSVQMPLLVDCEEHGLHRPYCPSPDHSHSLFLWSAAVYSDWETPAREKDDRFGLGGL